MPKETLDEALSKGIDAMLSDGGEEAQPAAEAAPEERTETPETLPDTEPTTTTPGTPAPAQPVATAPPGKAAEPEKPAATPKPPEPKAPQSWSPMARQQWATLPRDARDQILKREGEITRALNEAKDARKTHEQVGKVLEPYANHFRAQGVEPLEAVGGLLRMEYALRAGTPHQKAQVAANILTTYGVDIEALAAALEGRAPTQQPPQQAQFRDPRFDQFLGNLQSTQQRKQQAARAQHDAELETFASGAEFFDDVGAEMLAVMRASSSRGKELTYQEAYDRACHANPDVRKILEQRRAEEAQRKQATQVSRAQHAAGSVRTEPSAPAGSRKPTMEEFIQAGLGGRR